MVGLVSRVVAPDPSTRRRLVARMRRAGAAARRHGGRPVRWWSGLESAERVFYRAAAALAVGWALVWPPMILIVPGTLWALVFFGFSLRRSS